MSFPPAIPTLETERLFLRPWGEDLLDQIAEFYSDVENTRFIGGALDREDSWRRIAMHLGHWRLRGFGLFALVEKQTSIFAGYCGPYRPEGWPEQEIGWALSRSFQGQGFATEAVQAVRAYAYGELRWPTAVSYIRPDNIRSQRLAARVGASFEQNIVFRSKEAQVWRHPCPVSQSTKPNTKQE